MGKKRIKYFYIPLYILVLGFSLIGSFGFFEGLHAGGKVIETFEAGPIKPASKKVYKVKTQFEWTIENPCQCDGENPPCIKTFLNKDLPSEESREIQQYENLSESSDRYQGSNYVPTIIRESSVRIIIVPFCQGAKKSK